MSKTHKGHAVSPKTTANSDLNANEQQRIAEAEQVMGLSPVAARQAVKVAEEMGILKPDGSLG